MYEFWSTYLYLTRYGVKREPIIRIVIPTPIVAKAFSKGEKKYTNTNIGMIVKDTNMTLPRTVILSTVLQFSHSIGLYAHQKDLYILP